MIRFRATIPLTLLTIAATLLAGSPLRAQDVIGEAMAGEVRIEVDRFGVGDASRPASLAGIRLALTDRGDRVRDAIVRLHLRDPDGDEALVERPVTLNPGRAQQVWFYARLPGRFDRQSLLTVTVHERVEAGGQASAGRQISAARISPRRVVPSTDGMIAVVGRRAGGLEQYTVRDAGGMQTPTAHELIEVVSGLDAPDLPDAWMGLAPYEAIVWTEGDPTALRADQAQAIREYVNRGGRLIVTLPSVGQLWANTANPLIDLMPAISVTRFEDVDLNAYRRLLTSSAALPLPTRAVVHAFEPSPFAGESDAIPILNGPDGRTVVMRRLVGVGDVTLIGLDLADSRLVGRTDAQVLWHRILGKRFDVRSATVITERLSVARFPNPPSMVIDTTFSSYINKTGSAGVGVLLGLIVFAVYFILAGPGGFALLSKWGWRRHAWVAFVMIASVFTLVAWGGATMIRPRATDITHLSFIDSVHGQNTSRAQSWFSVLLPTYGSQTVEIGDPDRPAELEGDLRHVLWPWEDPTSAMRAPFPDRRSYSIDTRRPSAIRVPTRSTVKEFRADWVGPPPWRLPRPFGGSITIDENAQLHGRLIHELPAPLEKVIVVLVLGQTPLTPPREGGPLLANAWAWSPFGGGAWAPGDAFDLADLDLRDADTANDFFRSIAHSVGGLLDVVTGGARPDLSRAEAMFDAITWHSALAPPEWTGQIGAPGQSRRTLLQRQVTHGMDLGRWFTQPCLIVVGQVREAPMPTPVMVDGATPPSNGRTIVRWVHPLPSSPPRPARDGDLDSWR